MELLNKDGTVTASVDRVFSVEESHSGLVTALKDWTQIIEVLMESPGQEKRGRTNYESVYRNDDSRKPYI